MNEEIKDLINSLEIDSDRKQALLATYEKNGPSEEFAQELKGLLKENDASLQAEFPEAMQEIGEVTQQAGEQINRAYMDFQAEIEQINAEADAAYTKATTDMDGAQIEEARDALK